MFFKFHLLFLKFWILENIHKFKKMKQKRLNEEEIKKNKIEGKKGKINQKRYDKWIAQVG